jgi:hypothetical protein
MTTPNESNEITIKISRRNHAKLCAISGKRTFNEIISDLLANVTDDEINVKDIAVRRLEDY